MPISTGYLAQLSFLHEQCPLRIHCLCTEFTEHRNPNALVGSALLAFLKHGNIRKWDPLTLGSKCPNESHIDAAQNHWLKYTALEGAFITEVLGKEAQKQNYPATKTTNICRKCTILSIMLNQIHFCPFPITFCCGGTLYTCTYTDSLKLIILPSCTSHTFHVNAQGLQIEFDLIFA